MRYCENTFHQKSDYQLLIAVLVNKESNEGHEYQNQEYWCVDCIKKEMNDIDRTD
jgi:hypothetical protein